MLMKELPNCTTTETAGNICFDVKLYSPVYINNLAEWALSTRRRALVDGYHVF